MALFMSVATLLVLSSCNDGEEDTTLPPSISYPDTNVEVGTEKTITPSVQGDAATFEITNADGADNFVSVNASTGVITVSASAVEGVYNVQVKATNSAGTDNATAKITVTEPVVAPGVSYEAATVAIGSEGTITPAVTGDAATYAITDDDGATFVTINANTGELSVAKESEIGTYSVSVTATNSAGSDNATAEITIGINPLFDPTGKKFEWKIFMNRTEDITLVGLDGVPGLPSPSLSLPFEWPTESTPVDDLWQYGIMTGVQGLLLQVPGDEACGALDPTEDGDTLLIIVNEDLTISTECNVGGAPGSTVQIGISEITFADDKFVYTMLLDFLPGLSLPYEIDGAKIEEFTDVYTDPASPEVYQALQGTVIGMTTPTDLATQETIQDFTKWAYPNVDVVLKQIE